MRKHPWLSLAMALVLLLAAVGLAASALRLRAAPRQQAASMLTSTDRPVVGPSVRTETLSTPAPQRDTLEEQVARIARAHLAGRLGLSMETVRTVIVEDAIWPDACLGIPSEGIACAQALTPGYRILFDVAGSLYEYRADRVGLVQPVLSVMRPTDGSSGTALAAIASLTPAGQATAASLPQPSPSATKRVNSVMRASFALIDRGVSNLSAGTGVVKGRVLDRNSQPVINGHAMVAITFDGVLFRSSSFPNPVPTNGDGWYEVYVTPGQRVQIVRLLIDGHETVLDNASLSWVARKGQWWHVDLQQGPDREVSLAPTAAPTPVPTWQTPAQGYWYGEYYGNPSLSGSPALARNDPTINFDWGQGAPAAGLPQDRFSVRWTATPTIEAGAYTFFVHADDGVRLWIDNAPVIDQWREYQATTFTASRVLAAGQHVVRVEYYENTGAARCQVRWERAQATLPTSQAWRGEYFANTSLSGQPALVREDRWLSFDWGNNAPGSGLPRDRFSARWTATVLFEADTHTFYLTADDGARLWVDGALLIDAWRDQSETAYRASKYLAAGSHSLRVEYYENTDVAVCKLRWESSKVVPLPSSVWQGEYYANASLSGAPALTRNDSAIGFDWAYGAPLAGLPIDDFSVRWSRRVRFSDGYYSFRVRADDGVRVWVAGQLILDRWHGGYTDDTIKVLVRGGDQDVIVEFYELQGVAKIKVGWDKIEDKPKTRTPTPSPTPEPVISHWRGAYYKGTELKGSPVLVRNDEAIDFDWGQGAALPSLKRKDGFSVRWTRSVAFEQGAYRFIAQVDDGMRLWVDGLLLIDAWQRGPARTQVGHLYVERSGQHDIKVEYFDTGGTALIQLRWERIETFAGWKGEYYPNRYLMGEPAFVRDDEALRFDWGKETPGAGVPRDDFSVRWTRTIPVLAGRYRITAKADDGLRVFVDGQPVIDAWRQASSKTHVATFDLGVGEHSFVVEYYEHEVEARIGVTLEFVALAPVTSAPTPTQVSPAPAPTATLVAPTATVTLEAPTATPMEAPATATETVVPPTPPATLVAPTATATAEPPTATLTATLMAPTATATVEPPTATATATPAEAPATPTHTIEPATPTATVAVTVSSETQTATPTATPTETPAVTGEAVARTPLWQHESPREPFAGLPTPTRSVWRREHVLRPDP